MSASKTVIFTDLDDTLIQTRRKIPVGANTSLGATDREGNPLSFFTQSQKKLLDLFSYGDAIIIPVTGRNTEALNRVLYDFDNFRAVSHGAVVLKNNNTVCCRWLSEIEPHLNKWPELLNRCNEEIEEIINYYQLDARTRVIIDNDIPSYISVKGQEDALRVIGQHNGLRKSFSMHENGRNHAILPPYASKKKAVEYIMKQLNVDANDLVIGLGDSLSDLDFMQSCQFSMIPVNCQITSKLNDAKNT